MGNCRLVLSFILIHVYSSIRGWLESLSLRGDVVSGRLCVSEREWRFKVRVRTGRAAEFLSHHAMGPAARLEQTSRE